VAEILFLRLAGIHSFIHFRRKLQHVVSLPAPSHLFFCLPEIEVDPGKSWTDAFMENGNGFGAGHRT
jgi:hypothetical protein